MPTALTSRSCAYLTALTQEIEKKLQRALASPSQRRNLLQELFADVALEVDNRARDIILSREDRSSEAEDQSEGPICFYNVLADHFVSFPQNGRPILDLIVQLWSQLFASNIFTLLFHKWLFEFQLDNPEVLLRYSSALVQGATNVFLLICRIDIQSNTMCFQSLFRYLLDEVALFPDRLKKIPLQAQHDLFLLLSRFILFYNSADKLESFLKQFPDFPNAFLVGSPADAFVIEVADQLQKLKVEPVLLHYLSQVKVLQGLELRMTTSTRLKTCLYSFTSPGGPMYPTRAVRHAAWDALDVLFPVILQGSNRTCYIRETFSALPTVHSTNLGGFVLTEMMNLLELAQKGETREKLLKDKIGRYPRHVISLFFRLLYPWYWPSSCWNFIVACIQAVFCSLLRLIFSGWDRLTKHRQD